MCGTCQGRLAFCPGCWPLRDGRCHPASRQRRHASRGAWGLAGRQGRRLSRRRPEAGSRLRGRGGGGAEARRAERRSSCQLEGPRAVGLESHIRAKAARAVAERGKHPAGASSALPAESANPTAGGTSALPGSTQPAGGIRATPNPTHHETGGIVAPSPEQELHSKRSVEDVLSRLEGRTPNYANGNAAPSSTARAAA